MENIGNVSCVRFFEGSNSKGHFVNVTGAIKGCIAEVGYQQKAGQVLNLNSNCNTLGTAMHEVLHALGFFHQHSSYNRNEFIKIDEENINPENIKYFTLKIPENYATDFGYKYDYDSIMHYGPYAASKNKRKTIIALKEGGTTMGQRKSLSSIDILKLNKLYGCGSLFKKNKKTMKLN